MLFSNENSFHSPGCWFSPTRSFLFLKNSEVNWKSKQSSLLSLFINQNKLLHLNRKGFHRNFRKWNNTADGGILPYNCAYMHIATMIFLQSLETVRIVLCITWKRELILNQIEEMLTDWDKIGKIKIQKLSSPWGEIYMLQCVYMHIAKKIKIKIKSCHHLEVGLCSTYGFTVAPKIKVWIGDFGTLKHDM